jgi:hypothetical protein
MLQYRDDSRICMFPTSYDYVVTLLSSKAQEQVVIISCNHRFKCCIPGCSASKDLIYIYHALCFHFSISHKEPTFEERLTHTHSKTSSSSIEHLLLHKKSYSFSIPIFTPLITPTMENSALILTCKAVNVRTESAFRLEHNKDFYVPPPAETDDDIGSREVTPAPEVGVDCSSRIRLTFNNTPKDKQRWFFGSNPKTNDIVLGRHKDGISRRHFAITFDDDGRIVLEALSNTNTIHVNYDGISPLQRRQYQFKWILFEWANLITVTIDNPAKVNAGKSGPQDRPDYLQFDIRLVGHDDHRYEYQQRVQRFLSEARNSIDTIDQITFDSPDTTAPATQPITPGTEQNPIFLNVELIAQGKFGKVFRTVNVSTGEVYAAKCLIDPPVVNNAKSKSKVKPKSELNWEREIALLKATSHVSMILYPAEVVLLKQVLTFCRSIL